MIIILATVLTMTAVNKLNSVSALALPQVTSMAVELVKHNLDTPEVVKNVEKSH